jgi:protein-tyrosine-phosphatase/DNA-binding HxlR family transcriptional regulator
MNIEMNGVRRRAAIHGALAEPARLAVVETLLVGDASPGELGEVLQMSSNLVAHHLRVLEEAGVITRARSEADHRRTYVRLVPATLTALVPAAILRAPRVVFVCTHNSARSQLAAALWTQRSRVPAASAGTHPHPRVHRRAVAAARRHGLALNPARTAHVRDVVTPEDLVVVVCDNAYEVLGHQATRLHWSVPDPAQPDTDQAFELAFNDIQARVERLAAAIDDADPPGRTP